MFLFGFVVFVVFVCGQQPPKNTKTMKFFVVSLAFSLLLGVVCCDNNFITPFGVTVAFAGQEAGTGASFSWSTFNATGLFVGRPCCCWLLLLDAVFVLVVVDQTQTQRFFPFLFFFLFFFFFFFFFFFLFSFLFPLGTPYCTITQGGISQRKVLGYTQPYDTSSYQHHVVIDGLSPFTRYEYVVGMDEGVESSQYSFVTARGAGDFSSFRFEYK